MWPYYNIVHETKFPKSVEVFKKLTFALRLTFAPKFKLNGNVFYIKLVVQNLAGLFKYSGSLRNLQIVFEKQAAFLFKSKKSFAFFWYNCERNNSPYLMANKSKTGFFLVLEAGKASLFAKPEGLKEVVMYYNSL